MMNISDGSSHLQRKVEHTLTVLQKEAEEVSRDMISLNMKVTRSLEDASRSCNSLTDADVMKRFKEVSQELEVMDEQMTIIRATISSTCWSTEDDMVEDLHLHKAVQSSSSSNYLLGKLTRKLGSVQDEGMFVKYILDKLECKVEEVTEKAKETAKKLWLCDQDKIMQVFKKVSKELGFMDMEITMLRSAVSSCLESFEDNLEKVVGVEEIDDKINEIPRRKETLEETEIVTSETIKVKESVDVAEIEDQGENSHRGAKPDGELLEENITEAEVEKVLAMKLQENSKLLSICQASDKHRQLVKDRVKESMLRIGRTGSSASCVSDTAKLNCSMPLKEVEKLPVSLKAVDTKAQASTTSNCGYAASTSSMVETHRRHQLEQVRKKFGEYGEHFMVGDYKQFKMMFDSGCPAMFWLHVDTVALYDLQAIIQRKLRGKPTGDGGGAVVEVGSMVLARYPVDKAVYRAKVEEMLVGEEELFSVRYIDYGNRSDSLTRGDLYTWDIMLERIPPQAVPCCFYRAPGQIRDMTSLTLEEMEAFTSFMKQCSPMQMKVHECLSSYQNIFSPSSYQLDPELSVSLRGKDGRDILAKLSLLPDFKACVGHQQVAKAPTRCSSPSVAASLPMPASLTPLNIYQLDALNPPVSLHHVPPPLHLDGEELAQVCDDGPTSPLHPIFTSRAVEKVQWWLDRKENGDQQLREDWERRMEQHKNPSFQEPEFVQTNNTKRKAALLSQARKQLSQDDLSGVYDVSPHTNRAKKVTKSPKLVDASLSSVKDIPPKYPPTTVSQSNQPIQTARVYSSVDVRTEVTPAPPPYTPPSLDIQEVELDDNGEFQFMVSVIISPEEIYVHPVQESSGYLAQLERELDMIVEGDHVAREVEVVAGSVWGVFQQVWYRGEVVSVSNVSFGHVRLRSVDYGHVLIDVYVRHLNHLPPGLATNLPGLAVRCHMAMVRPVHEEGWDKLAIQILTNCLGGSELHTALFVERKERSIGVVLMMEQLGKFNTVNKRLVDVGCAVSSVFGDHDGVDDLGDSGLANDWDPMAEDYNSTTNNYMTNDDDLEIATDGYRSKDKVCAFYLNRGTCYKGAYCEDKHAMPREGAVTADQEEVVIGTVDMLDLPTVSTTVLVRVTWVMSPSAFYITFPHGIRDFSTLQPSDVTQNHSTMFSNLQANMQMFYQGNSRKLYMDSLPAPGSLLVTKSERDKLWHRAMARDSSEGEVEVFFVDLGQVEVVALSNTRKLESCFSVLPFQAVLACLAQVEPLGQGWCKEATTLFRRLTSSSQYLTAKVMASLPEQPLVVELSTRLQLTDKPHLDMSVVLEENGWAKKVEIKEKGKFFSVHVPG